MNVTQAMHTRLWGMVVFIVVYGAEVWHYQIGISKTLQIQKYRPGRCMLEINTLWSLLNKYNLVLVFQYSRYIL